MIDAIYRLALYGRPADVGEPITKIFDPFELDERLYVEPEEAAEIERYLKPSRKSLLVEGAAGMGKSTAVEYALRKLNLTAATRWFHCRFKEEWKELDQVLDTPLLAGQYLVLDDFHRLDRSRQERVTRLIKILASPGPGRSPSGKLVLVGTSPISSSLVSYLHDASGFYGTVRMNPQSDDKIANLVARASKQANVDFADARMFVSLAGGSFAVVQQLCREAALLQGYTRVLDEKVRVTSAWNTVVEVACAKMDQDFKALIHEFVSFDERDLPRGAALLLLLNLSGAESGSVAFSIVRTREPELRNAFDWLEANLSDLFSKKPGLSALFRYNQEAGVLSIQHPLLRFYMRFIDWPQLSKETNHNHVSWVSGKPEFCWGPVPSPSPAAWPPPSPLPAQPNASVSEPAPRPAVNGTQGTRSLVLHLSDLHFADMGQATAWHNQLASDLRHELQVDKLDALVVSGDIANTAEPAQYEAATRFLQEIANEFELAPRHIVLVPGNHDVNWTCSRDAYEVKYRESYKAPLISGTYIDGGKYVEVPSETEYPHRFAPFSKFYEAVCAKPYPLDAAEQATLHHFPEQNLLFLGLNSAWFIDHHFTERAGLHVEAVSRALSQIRMTPTFAPCTKLAIWHHPPSALQAVAGMDEHLLEQLAQAGFRFVLHGHIHAATNDLFRYYRSVTSGGLEIISAGTFGAPTKELLSGYPFQYQLLEFAPTQITVHTRRKENVSGAWKPDARWLTEKGHDPRPRYTILLP